MASDFRDSKSGGLGESVKKYFPGPNIIPFRRMTRHWHTYRFESVKPYGLGKEDLLFRW